MGKGVYFYFYTNYNQPTTMVFPMVPGFEITKLWDENRREAEKMAKIYYNKPKVCDTIEEMVENIAVATAARLSQKERRKVGLKEV